MKRKNSSGKPIKIAFKPEQFNWTNGLVSGEALIVLGGTMDSFGKNVKKDIQYKVGKHKKLGYAMIIPEDQIDKLIPKK